MGCYGDWVLSSAMNFHGTTGVPGVKILLRPKCISHKLVSTLPKQPFSGEKLDHPFADKRLGTTWPD